jgi:hypothetical protein
MLLVVVFKVKFIVVQKYVFFCVCDPVCRHNRQSLNRNLVQNFLVNSVTNRFPIQNTDLRNIHDFA